ncbi:MAG: glycosyltransferase family 39 protein [Chloroflexi bacterium]|nr:glycosyltransferase family 39 protein [Chloroflexota bacterium]
MLLAALLRIHNLDANGLWGDEGWSVEFSEPSSPALVTQNLVDDLHPPFYFITLSAWRQVAGDSEIPMRFWAVCPALLTVALVDRIGRKLFSPSAGIAAGLVLALADKHILLSQEVRHYPLAFMWMAASSLAFLHWLENPTRRRTLLYASIMIAAVYTHYYTALILPVQVIYAGLVLRPVQRIWKLLFMMGLALLAFVPWALVAVHQLLIRPEGILHSMPLSWATADTLTIDYLGRPVILGIGLILLGALSIKNRGQFLQWNESPAVWYPVLWLAVPIIISIVVYPVVTVLTDRNLALLLLPIAILAGHGIVAFHPPGRYILAALVVVNGLASADSRYVQPDWRSMAHFVEQNYPVDEPVLMDVRGGDKALGYYLRRLLPSGTQVISLNQWRIDYGIYFLGPVQDLLEKNDGFWVAYWGDGPYEMDNVYQNYGYTQTATRRFYHLGAPIDWYHYDRLPNTDEILGTFGDTIRLHRVKTAYEVKRGGTLNVSLWWSAPQTPSISYSISVFLMDGDGILRAQDDSAPQNGKVPTTTWIPDQVVFDSHAIKIPKNLSAGEYQLAVKVYNSADGQILHILTDSAISQEYLIIGAVQVR